MNKIVASIVALLLGTLAQASAQQTVHIRVVNGYTGKLLLGARMMTVTTSKNFEYGLPLVATQDGDGYKVLVDNETLIGMGAITFSSTAWNQYQLCASGTNLNPIYPASTIFASGLVAPNDCDRKITFSPRPGEVVFFVRRLSLWQRLKDSIAS